MRSAVLTFMMVFYLAGNVHAQGFKDGRLVSIHRGASNGRPTSSDDSAFFVFDTTVPASGIAKKMDPISAIVLGFDRPSSETDGDNLANTTARSAPAIFERATLIGPARKERTSRLTVGVQNVHELYARAKTNRNVAATRRQVNEYINPQLVVGTMQENGGDDDGRYTLSGELDIASIFSHEFFSRLDQSGNASFPKGTSVRIQILDTTVSLLHSENDTWKITGSLGRKSEEAPDAINEQFGRNKEFKLSTLASLPALHFTSLVNPGCVLNLRIEIGTGTGREFLDRPTQGGISWPNLAPLSFQVRDLKTTSDTN